MFVGYTYVIIFLSDQVFVVVANGNSQLWKAKWWSSFEFSGDFNHSWYNMTTLTGQVSKISVVILKWPSI